MSQDSFKPHDLIDEYIDGRLSQGDRKRFEKAMLADVTLAAAVTTQVAIDTSLRRSYLPPAVIPVPHQPTAPSAPAHTSSPLRINWRNTPWLRVAAAAAILLFGIGMLIHMWTEEFPSVSVPPRPTMDQVYKSEVANGFVPGWKCENDKQFSDTFKTRFGEALLMKDTPENVRALGLSYRGCMSDNTTYMLAKVDNANVMVFVDREECSSNVGLADSKSGLHLFTRNVGGLTLYELTPLEQPKLLSLFYEPTGAATQTAGSSTKKWN